LCGIVNATVAKNAPPLLWADSALPWVLIGAGTCQVRACVYATLLEVNERLVLEPSLLHDKARTDGYIALIQPSDDRCAPLPHLHRD
jgi:hypothetical protein